MSRGEAGRIEGCLPEETLFDGGHAGGEELVLFAERGGILLEIVDPVLLAERAHAEHQNSSHEAQLEEAVLSLYRVREEPHPLLSSQNLLLESLVLPRVRRPVEGLPEGFHSSSPP